MPNPHLFDSDWDYYDACLTDEQRMALAIAEGDSDILVDEFAAWVVKHKLAELTENEEWVEEFVKQKMDWIDEP